MLLWSDPILLPSYASAPKGPGIYAIGTPEDLGSPVGVAPDYDPYLGLWPENLTPLYVGISESRGSGVRGRLSSHWRRTGNKGIAGFRDRGLPLWFVTIRGLDLVECEAVLLCLRNTTMFTCNVRPETDRSARRQAAKVRARMSESDRLFYDHLDMGEHGEGM